MRLNLSVSNHTVLVPIILAEGKTEDDLLNASAVFIKDFVADEEGMLRHELGRKPVQTRYFLQM